MDRSHSDYPSTSPAAEQAGVRPAPPSAGAFAIELGNADFQFRTAYIADQKVVGAQIVEAAGERLTDEVVILRHLTSGELESLRMTEPVDLAEPGVERFFVLKGDELYRFVVERLSMEWPRPGLAARHIKFLAKAQPDEELIQDKAGGDIVLDDDAIVDISRPGVERLRLRKQTWTLNVHGVQLVLSTPTILARDALTQAGFDISQNWQIFLKVAGKPATPISLDYVVDLRTPGIEKLRLSLNDINNGEVPLPTRRAFALLPVDHAHLDRLSLRWETLIEDGRRWLLIHNYPILEGYRQDLVTLALEIPPDYPGAAIYGFFTHPPLTLSSGRTIPNPRPECTIDGRPYGGWSRYRAGQQWNSSIDNIVTQLALVELSLAKEVGQ